MALLRFCGLLFRLLVFVIALKFNICPSSQLLFIQVKQETGEDYSQRIYLHQAEVKVGFIML